MICLAFCVVFVFVLEIILWIRFSEAWAFDKVVVTVVFAGVSAFSVDVVFVSDFVEVSFEDVSLADSLLVGPCPDSYLSRELFKTSRVLS